MFKQSFLFSCMRVLGFRCRFVYEGGIRSLNGIGL